MSRARSSMSTTNGAHAPWSVPRERNRMCGDPGIQRVRCRIATRASLLIFIAPSKWLLEILVHFESCCLAAAAGTRRSAYPRLGEVRASSFQLILEVLDMAYPDSPTPQAVTGLIRRSVRQWNDYRGAISFANPLSLYGGTKSLAPLRGVLNQLAEEMDGYKRSVTVDEFKLIKPTTTVGAIRGVALKCF